MFKGGCNVIMEWDIGFLGGEEEGGCNSVR